MSKRECKYATYAFPLANKKRGLSNIVATVLIILLALTAIAIVWGIIQNVVVESSEEAQQKLNLQQTKFSIVPSSVTNDCNEISFIVKRESGGADLNPGVIIVLIDINGESATLKDYEEEEFAVLESKKITASASDLGLNCVKQIIIYPSIKGEGDDAVTFGDPADDYNFEEEELSDIISEPLNRAQYLGFSHIYQNVTIRWKNASQNSDYVLIVSKINWSEYNYSEIPAGGWDLDEPIFASTKYLADKAREEGLKVYIAIDPLDSFDRLKIDQDIPWSDKSFGNPNVWKAFYQYSLLVATEIKPDYLTLGIEMNTYYRSELADFGAFAWIYNESYQGIRADTSLDDIKIGPTFQYEELTGYGPDSPDITQYKILDNFESNSDFLGLTTYPRIAFSTVSNMPSDYYSQIRDYSSKPIVIGESGWPTSNEGGLPSTESEQANYLYYLLNETKDLDTELVVWWFLYDVPQWIGYGEFFGRMGLLDEEDSAKPSWTTWKDYYDREKI